MVTYSTPHRDAFRAIADPSRRAIINLLIRNSLTLNQIAEHFEMSRPAVSKHIRYLTECGVVAIEKRGRERYCTIRLDQLTEVTDWIEQTRNVWNKRLDALEETVAELVKKEKEGKNHGRKK